MKKWNNTRGHGYVSDKPRVEGTANERHFTGSKVEVRNGDAGFALRKLKKILERNDFQKDLSKHEYFEKPGIKRKRAKEMAIKNQQRELNKQMGAGLIQNRSANDLKFMKSKRKRRKILDQQNQILRMMRARNKGK